MQGGAGQAACVGVLSCVSLVAGHGSACLMWFAADVRQVPYGLHDIVVSAGTLFFRQPFGRRMLCGVMVARAGSCLLHSPLMYPASSAVECLAWLCCCIRFKAVVGAARCSP